MNHSYYWVAALILALVLWAFNAHAQTLIAITDYFPQPPHGAVWNKTWYAANGTTIVKVWQYRNADVDGLPGARLDTYSAGLVPTTTWYYRTDPSTKALLEYQDYTFNPTVFMKLIPGKEINWGTPAPIDQLLPSISKQFVLVGGWTGFHTVYLNAILPSLKTPFGTFVNVLVVPFTQTSGVNSWSGVYYMIPNRGPIRIDIPGEGPRFARDNW